MDNNIIEHKKQPLQEEPEVVVPFDYAGFQVARREIFAHRSDPAINIRPEGISFNMACIKKFEGAMFIQVLVNPTTHKLAIRACDEDAKDSVRWCAQKDGKRRPRSITCRLFVAKLYDMMGWNSQYRYKIQGYAAYCDNEFLYVFDLNEIEMYYLNSKAGDGRNIRRPLYPENWKDSFGLPVEEHKKALQIDYLNGYATLDLYNRPRDEDFEQSNEQMTIQMGGGDYEYGRKDSHFSYIPKGPNNNS